MVYISICSLVGSISVMAVKGFGIALKLTFAGNNQLWRAGTWVFAFVVVGCIGVQMNYFNKVSSILLLPFLRLPFPPYIALRVLSINMIDILIKYALLSIGARSILYKRSQSNLLRLFFHLHHHRFYHSL